MQVCPITFVRAKLAVEKLKPGETLEIRLNSGEPLHNVPRSLVEHGYTVEMRGPERIDMPEGVHRIRVTR
ncbi:sulfurtransferase TusA family protein [Nitrospirillum pindoramense]|uniref:sulfurtransferase TusA family protein n=1 Tax=Nitrospirillum amazonense TaxID=28077 RepID=UPI0011A4BE59|nr:sulfurtransferase TusA family protein [Nitrospirillum amazonense]